MLAHFIVTHAMMVFERFFLRLTLPSIVLARANLDILWLQNAKKTWNVLSSCTNHFQKGLLVSMMLLPLVVMSELSARGGG